VVLKVIGSNPVICPFLLQKILRIKLTPKHPSYVWVLNNEMLLRVLVDNAANPY
jgi:hypothetical protein